MQKMRAMLAFIQFCIFFIIGSHLPLGFPKVSADYLRELSVIIVTPRFVFILGNAIVIILVLKSGNSLDKDNNGSASTDNKVEHGRNHEYVYKEPRIRVSGPDNKIRRSQSSENMARVHRLKEAAASGKELRRQATFTCRKRDVAAATDEMSNEEFRRRVETFIARQQRSLREEEFSSLLVSCES